MGLPNIVVTFKEKKQPQQLQEVKEASSAW